MRPLNRRTLSRVQARIDASFFTDRATLRQKTVTGRDDYGQPVFTTTETELQGSFADKIPGKDPWVVDGDILQVVAEWRYKGITPAKGNTLLVTSRFNGATATGQTYTEQEFEVVAIRDRGLFGYVLGLKAVDL